MKKIFVLISLILSLYAQDIMMYKNSYDVINVSKEIKSISVGDKKVLDISLFNDDNSIKIFGKSIGNSPVLIFFRDNSYKIYHIYVSRNLKFLEKSIKDIEPNINLCELENNTIAIKGVFDTAKIKKRVYELLHSAGFNKSKIIDLTTTKEVKKMIRTKLYLVEINNQRAKDLGGVTGLGFQSDKASIGINGEADNAVTFSGFLLNNVGSFTDTKGGAENSIRATLNFLESKGVAKILDDTVLITTEDKNATFRVGGEVYIPTGITQNANSAPTIQVTQKKYGLKLTLNTSFMNKKNFMNMRIDIQDSEFDTNPEHNVKLGEYTEVPSFISKNITTDIVAKSGQVIALGGRLHTEKVLNKEKVPFLGDIPIVGEAFKHKKEDSTNSDLLFFLIPEIVNPNTKLDERHFYADTKKSDQILDKELTNPIKKATVPAVAVSKQPIIKAKSIKSKKVSNKTNQLVDKKTQVKSFKANVIEKEIVKKPSKIKTTKKVNEDINNQKIYKVTVKKVFLRSSPVDGKIVAIWIQGHKFVVQKIKKVDNNIWLKVKEDCFQNKCKDAKVDMWIAKRFTNKVI